MKSYEALRQFELAGTSYVKWNVLLFYGTYRTYRTLFCRHYYQNIQIRSPPMNSLSSVARREKVRRGLQPKEMITISPPYREKEKTESIGIPFVIIEGAQHINP